MDQMPPSLVMKQRRLDFQFKSNSKSKSKSASSCGGCGCREEILHNVRHRGTYVRFCTNCLLKIHHGLFCPFCFQLFQSQQHPLPPPSSPAQQPLLLCLNCPSISHLSCLPSSYSLSPPNSFLCPCCSDIHFSFFHFSSTALDNHSARALVAAAQIAALSMTQAAADARLHADTRVMEAAFAKKRAREALETLAFLDPINNKHTGLSLFKDTSTKTMLLMQAEHPINHNNDKSTRNLGGGGDRKLQRQQTTTHAFSMDN